MPQERLPMRKLRDVLRLTASGLSSRKVAASLGMGASTVTDCLQRGTGRRRRLAAAGGADGRGAGEPALSSLDGAGRDQGAAAAAGLASDPSRAPAEGRDAAAALGGVCDLLDL